ncbi:MAG: hypothetical protein ACREK1_09605 [Longimicrobiales bacterium]
MMDSIYSTVSVAILFGMLVIAGAVVYRARGQRAGITKRALTDDMVRQIEETGYIDVDEPLDLEQIQDEEARFWEEQPWEEPEEY